MGKYWKSRDSIKSSGQKNNSVLTNHNHNHIKEQFKDMQSKFLQNNKIQKNYASTSKAMKSLVPTKTRPNTFFNNIWKVKYMWQFLKTQGEKRKLNSTLKNTSENCKKLQSHSHHWHCLCLVQFPMWLWWNYMIHVESKGGRE